MSTQTPIYAPTITEPEACAILHCSKTVIRDRYVKKGVLEVATVHAKNTYLKSAVVTLSLKLFNENICKKHQPSKVSTSKKAASGNLTNKEGMDEFSAQRALNASKQRNA